MIIFGLIGVTIVKTILIAVMFVVVCVSLKLAKDVDTLKQLKSKIVSVSSCTSLKGKKLWEFNEEEQIMFMGILELALIQIDIHPKLRSTFIITYCERAICDITEHFSMSSPSNASDSIIMNNALLFCSRLSTFKKKETICYA